MKNEVLGTEFLLKCFNKFIILGFVHDGTEVNVFSMEVWFFFADGAF